LTVGDPGQQYGSQLYALNLKTGETIWNYEVKGTGWTSHATYLDGRIFVINFDGLMQAFSADDAGTFLWKVKLPWQNDFSNPPVAGDGKVFAIGGGEASNVYAIGEDAEMLWTTPVDSFEGSPALAAGGIFVTPNCQYAKLSERIGKVIWWDNRHCEGGVGGTPVYFDGQIYALDSNAGNAVLDAKDGKILGSFDASQSPAIWSNPTGHALMIAPTHAGAMKAVDIRNGTIAWSFTGDDAFLVPAIVINDMVVAGANSGTLYLLDAKTGKNLWSADVGAPIGPTNRGGPLAGLGGGGGTLFVPAQYTLSASVITK